MRDRIARKGNTRPSIVHGGPRGHVAPRTPDPQDWPSSVARDGAIPARDEQTMLAGLEQNPLFRPDAAKFVHGTIGRAKEELSEVLLARAAFDGRNNIS